MANSRSIVLASIALVAAVHAAHAEVIFNTFGPGDAYATTGGQNVSTFVNVGVSFTPAANTTPARAILAMKSTSGGTPTIAICADVNNHPGSVLFSTSIIVNAGDPELYTAMFDAATELTAGTTYWVRASGGVEFWMPTSTTQTGYAFTSTSGAWNHSTNGATPAVRIENDAIVIPTGACCNGSTCTVTLSTACNAMHTRFAGGMACNSGGSTTTPCCVADYNQSGGLEVQDIFDYLNAWFAGGATADINGGGLEVQDIFDFLNAWFAGC